ncbi:MAG TPA: lysophospholipid acyltransferase family protein [Thermoanaerobaculia bacterium]|jgi:lysophospholipid acyltransferase (LPLAT)-like uncharacterized protein|nr:lysophospholipid acyltransferase family protein [Thermoanaerobaculia bacterium]
MKFVSFLAYLLVRTLTATLRLKHVHREHIDDTPQYILTFWHRQLLPLLGRGKWRRPITVMISKSKDGEIIANVLALYGVSSARGSSSRGGSEALRGILREARDGKSIVFTPDGPRGPAGVLKDGVIFAAQASKLPIMPFAFAGKNVTLLRSWDRMIVPKPFSKGVIVYGEPIVVPRDGDPEEWRLRIEQVLNELSAEAERFVNE